MRNGLKERVKSKIEDKARNYIRKKAAGGDERIALNVSNAASITLYITYSYLVIVALYKMVTNKSFLSEIILLLLIPLVFSIAQKKTKGYSPLPPTLTNGTFLNTEKSKEGKKRRLKAYLSDSLKYAIFFQLFTAVIDLLRGDKYFYTDPNFIKNTISYTLLYFIIFFIISYFYGEKAVKKYNKYIDSLDRED